MSKGASEWAKTEWAKSESVSQSVCKRASE